MMPENSYQTSGRCRDPLGRAWEVAMVCIGTRNPVDGEQNVMHIICSLVIQ